MIKKNSSILFFIVLLISVLFVCSCAKRDKLQNSNVLIDINPSYVNMLPQTETTFVATVKSVEGKKIDKQVTWTASSGTITNAGVYNSPTITTPQTVTISARLDDIVRSINIRIVNELPVTTNRYYFYTDEFGSNNPNVSKLKFDTLHTSSSGDVNGGYLGKIGGDDLDFSASTTVYYEGAESLKLAFTSAYAGIGIYFQFGYVSASNPGDPIITDLSAYNTLKFAFKAEAPFNNATFSAYVYANSTVYQCQIQNLDNYSEWGVVTFKPSSLKNFEKLLFVTDTQTTGTFYIDDIYFCKE